MSVAPARGSSAAGTAAGITVDLGAGPHRAVIRSDDLTAAHVHENSEYPS